jgi:hypothetical protein
MAQPVPAQPSVWPFLEQAEQRTRPVSPDQDGIRTMSSSRPVRWGIVPGTGQRCPGASASVKDGFAPNEPTAGPCGGRGAPNAMEPPTGPSTEIPSLGPWCETESVTQRSHFPRAPRCPRAQLDEQFPRDGVVPGALRAHWSARSRCRSASTSREPPSWASDRARSRCKMLSRTLLPSAAMLVAGL